LYNLTELDKQMKVEILVQAQTQSGEVTEVWFYMLFDKETVENGGQLMEF
jgi:hypothetical protein